MRRRAERANLLLPTRVVNAKQQKSFRPRLTPVRVHERGEVAGEQRHVAPGVGVQARGVEHLPQPGVRERAGARRRVVPPSPGVVREGRLRGRGGAGAVNNHLVVIGK